MLICHSTAHRWPPPTIASCYNTTCRNTLYLLRSGNAIDVAGAKALAEALAVNTSLTSLTLSDNYIGLEGAKALAEALAANNTLTEIGLRGNELGDEGLEALAMALLVRMAHD